MVIPWQRGGNSMKRQARGADTTAGRDTSVQKRKKRVAELEKALAEAQSQRDHSKELVRVLTTGRITVEELRRFAEDDDETGCLVLEDFVAELEAMVTPASGH